MNVNTRDGSKMENKTHTSMTTNRGMYLLSNCICGSLRRGARHCGCGEKFLHPERPNWNCDD